MRVAAAIFDHIDNPTRADLAVVAGVLCVLAAMQFTWWAVFGFPEPPLPPALSGDSGVGESIR